MQLRKNIKYITNLYKANQAHGVNKNDLRKTVNINYLLAKLFAFSFSFTTIMLMLSPIPVYVVTGEIIPTSAVKIPFISSEPVIGYILHWVFHFFGAFNGLLGLVAIDVFMVTTTMHIWPMTQILQRAVMDLNGATKDIKRDSVKNSVWLKLRMRNITLMHREMFL